MNKLALWGLVLFAALPATANYHLNSYGFGSGGTSGSQTATYAIEGGSGELSGQVTSTVNSSGKPGFTQTQQANVPQLSALDNGSGQFYNKLHFVIDNQNNPTDATYLLAVSTDNFASSLSYLQPDGTLSTTLNLSDYQTYSAWGAATGSSIIGLNPSTTYSVKLKATQGKFTESAYGPVSSQATAAPSLSFGLTTSTQSTPPFSVSFGTLTSGSVATSAQTINTTFTTNGTTGGDIYLSSQNGGLLSGGTGNIINATSTDLSSASHGFGAQDASISQTSGGPFTVVSPYNGTANNVGIINSTMRSLYSSTAPISGGAGTLNLKAKAASTDVAATDYQEILTLIAAANF